MTAVKAGCSLLVGLGAVVLSRAVMGADGTRGALVGCAIGGVLCLASFLILRQVQQADAKKLKLVILGPLVSFALLVVAVLLVRYFAAALVKPAALTALAVYLAYRAAEVVEFTRSSGIAAGPSASPRLGGGDVRSGRGAP